MYNKLESMIKSLKKDIDQLHLAMKVFLMNKNIPLEVRWELFELANKENVVSEVDNYGPSLRSLDKLGIDSPYDYLYCDRYQTLYYVDMIKSLEDYIGSTDKMWKKIDLTEEKIDTIKEEILIRFPEIGFIYDW